MYPFCLLTAQVVTYGVKKEHNLQSARTRSLETGSNGRRTHVQHGQQGLALSSRTRALLVPSSGYQERNVRRSCQIQRKRILYKVLTSNGSGSIEAPVVAWSNQEAKYASSVPNSKSLLHNKLELILVSNTSTHRTRLYFRYKHYTWLAPGFRGDRITKLLRTHA